MQEFSTANLPTEGWQEYRKKVWLARVESLKLRVRTLGTADVCASVL